jgi:hypothetical protein
VVVAVLLVVLFGVGGCGGVVVGFGVGVVVFYVCNIYIYR